MAPCDVDAYLAWRTRPEVSRWLLRTRSERSALCVSPTTDPDDHTLVALSGSTVVGAGFVSVRDGMGQDCGDTARATEALLGWNVDPDHWGRGVGTQVAGALLDLAFGELGLRRVTAGCFADNTASWRLMERVGMRREQHGIADSWHAQLGWVDGYTYAMLASEWEAGDAGRRHPSHRR